MEREKQELVSLTGGFLRGASVLPREHGGLVVVFSKWRKRSWSLKGLELCF